MDHSSSVVQGCHLCLNADVTALEALVCSLFFFTNNIIISEESVTEIVQLNYYRKHCPFKVNDRFVLGVEDEDRVMQAIDWSSSFY